MKITFLVGNGFDLGLGLKTSYNDFITDFLSPSSNGAEFESFAWNVLRKVIEPDIETWSDAEMAFAKLDFYGIFEEYSDKRASILRLLESFKSDLDAYLKREEKKFFPTDLSSVSGQFKARMIKSLIEGLAAIRGDSVRGNSVAGNIKAYERASVNVINFNYTYILDYMFWGSTGRSFDAEFVCNLDDGSELNLRIGNVHHVHGSLSAGNTLFGVSSVSQIEDDEARGLAEYSGTLIKSQMDKEENGNQYAAALQDLRSSDMVVLFGLSFGASDKLWWHELVKFVLGKDNKRVHIFPYARDPNPISTQMGRSLLRYEWRQKLFASIRSELSESDFSALSENMDKIVVLPYGPYTKHKGGSPYGDPWDLSYFSKLVLKDL